MATHKELITSGKFDEKFKRALLDYYSYGFKNLGTFGEKKRQTLSADWLRLNHVLADYLEWSGDRNKVMFASADSQSMQGNPFHRIYRFCKYNPFTGPASFLLTMAALSDAFVLRDGLEAVCSTEDQRIRLEDIIQKKEAFKTSDLLCFYPDALTSAGDCNRTLNNRLDELANLGLVACRQNVGAQGGSGDRRWRLPTCTMGRLLAAGGQADAAFGAHLRDALDFFANYYLFGAVGSFLGDRLSHDATTPFRFKHEYFMQSMNDCNNLDLLSAIEQHKWCKIQYRHGIENSELTLLCFPLELRISNMQGRQFLMYYEPFQRSYASLRIEFIDSIVFYDDAKVRQVLAKTGAHPTPQTIEQDIANARQSLGYTWGVSTTKQSAGNAIAPAPHHPVTLQLAYNPETDGYIKNRLLRERRLGTVAELSRGQQQCLQFTANVSDDTELRPWVRSFYARLLQCDGMDAPSFALNSDLSRMAQGLQGGALQPPKVPHAHRSKQGRAWGLPADAKAALGTGEKPRAHELLFHEVFGVYYYIIADVFVDISAAGEGVSFTIKELRGLIEASLQKFSHLIGDETEYLLPDELLTLLQDGGFLKEITRPVQGKSELVENKAGTGYVKHERRETAYVSAYALAAGVSLYRDVVPLTTLELRWLKTIAEDEKLRLFLSAAEVQQLRTLLAEAAPEATPLPMQKVVFFDRFHFPAKDMARERAVLATILEGIRTKSAIRLRYHTMQGGVKIGVFNPIVLQFSKRNNRFQGFFQHSASGRIFTFNIARIETAAITTRSFDAAAAQGALAAVQAKNTTSVTVEFYNVRGVADRILTEFSPWKKRCAYDPNTQLYRLTIFYQKPDEMDLVVRLLGYGADIRFLEKEHSIFLEIQSRVHRQMTLVQTHDRAPLGREPGDDR